jgi:hypothetical protein
MSNLDLPEDAPTLRRIPCAEDLERCQRELPFPLIPDDEKPTLRAIPTPRPRPAVRPPVSDNATRALMNVPVLGTSQYLKIRREY